MIQAPRIELLNVDPKLDRLGFIPPNLRKCEALSYPNAHCLTPSASWFTSRYSS